MLRKVNWPYDFRNRRFDLEVENDLLEGKLILAKWL